MLLTTGMLLYITAIECEVLSNKTLQGREVIDCLVTDAHSIKCAEPAAEVNTTIQVIGPEKESGSNCLGVEVGQKYLISGHYIVRKECDDKQWFAAKMVSGTDNEGNTLTTKRPMVVKSTEKHRRTMAKAIRNSCPNKS